MATVDECRAALEDLVTRMTGPGGNKSTDTMPNRSLSFHLTDLGVTFGGQLRDGGIHDITTDPTNRAQIRLTATSDDLVALMNGHLHFGSAWAKGRIKIEASVMDLLRLRRLL